MAQDYTTFKTYITSVLWRPNDAELANNLDVLIQQSNDELEQMTRDFQRRQKTLNILPTSQDFDLTTNVPDFQAIKSLTNNSTSFYRGRGPQMQQVLPQDIYARRTRQITPIFQPVYAVDRDDGTLYLRLVGNFSVTDPGDFQMFYLIGIPDYATENASWLEDEYLNLYLYTILKHCAIFLREDERIQAYSALQAEAFALADQDDKHNLQFGGSPLRMKPHHYVP